MSDEARLLFSAYRPNGQDANDPTFAAAIEAAKSDSTLAQWLADQQEFDRAVARSLREVVVPADLRAKILAGAQAGRRRSWWAAPGLWALAAALALFAGIGALWPGKTDALADWQKHELAVLGEILAARETFDLRHPDATALTAWLHDHATALPSELDGKPPIGCKTIAWHGHRMSLVCFDLGGGVAVHLFATERAGLAHLPPDGPPRFAHEGTWTVAMWNEGEKTLMLASDRGEETLRHVLQIAALSPAPVPPTLAAIRCF